MPAEVLPRLFCIIDLKKKEHHEHQAYPKLKIEVIRILIKRYSPKGIYGDTDNEQQRQHKRREVKCKL